MINIDELYMKEALKEAKKAFNKGEIPVGSVIVKNNKIIARGHNLRENKKNVIKHAEIIALEKACKKLDNWRLIDCTIYITMYPCPMCASAIHQSRLSKIVYGTLPDLANQKVINDILMDKNYGLPVEIVGKVLENDCAKLVKNFFLKKR